MIGEVIDLRLLGCCWGMSLLVLAPHSESPEQGVLILALLLSKPLYLPLRELIFLLLESKLPLGLDPASGVGWD